MGLFQVKIWFQNRRTKWKKMECGASVNDSETKDTGDDVMTSKSHLEVCRGVTLTSDSLSSTSSSPTARRHPGQTSVRQEHSQTPTIPVENVLDMSVEPEVPLKTGCSVPSKHFRWENVEEDRGNDADDSAVDNVSLSDYKTVVDLSTSKTVSTDVDHRSSERRRQVSPASDLDGASDSASRRSSLLTSTVVLSQPMSAVHN